MVCPLRRADDGFGGGAGAGLGEINWGQHQLVPFEKNFYMEHPDVTAMTKEEVFLPLHGRCAEMPQGVETQGPCPLNLSTARVQWIESMLTHVLTG